GQESLKPEGARILPAVNDFQNHALCRHRRAGVAEVQLHLAAIGALERVGNRALERKSAPLTPRRNDEAHLARAVGADVAFGPGRPPCMAILTDIRVKERQGALRPALHGGGKLESHGSSKHRTPHPPKPRAWGGGSRVGSPWLSGSGRRDFSNDGAIPSVINT